VKRAVVLALLVACSSDPKPTTGNTPSPTAQARRGSATGYASGLASDLAREGITAPPPIPDKPVPVPAPAPAAVPSPVPVPAPAPVPAPVAVPAPAPVPAPVAGSASPSPSAKHIPVKVPSDLAAIKLNLEPNWDRDVDEAGTISFVLRISQSGDTRTFSFHYGYDDPKAPADCDDYAKWLNDGKKLNVTLHRQRGGACYIEGLDDKGVAVFRDHVTYGGRALYCGGPQYKDPVNNPLGDLRDSVVMAGKKICETLAL
jgi:hypothetical protein